jgi:hypothetical protein
MTLYATYQDKILQRAKKTQVETSLMDTICLSKMVLRTTRHIVESKKCLSAGSVITNNNDCFIYR